MGNSYCLAAISLLFALATLGAGQSTALAAPALNLLPSGGQANLLVDTPLTRIVLQPVAQRGQEGATAFGKFDGWAVGDASGLAVMNYVDRTGRLHRVYVGSDRRDGLPLYLIGEEPEGNRWVFQGPDSLPVKVTVQPLQREGQTAMEVEVYLDSSIGIIRELRWNFPLLNLGPGYLAVPQDIGVLMGDKPATVRFRTYAQGGLSMPFVGLVRPDSAALVYWDSPDADLVVSVKPKTEVTDVYVQIALVQTSSPWKVGIQLPERPDYVGVAGAYRKIAKERGRLVSLREKISLNPALARLVGAVNLKFVLIGETFEAHLPELEKLKTMGIDRAMVLYLGWMQGGYDINHPDVITYPVSWNADAKRWEDEFGHAIAASAVTPLDETRGEARFPVRPAAGGATGLRAAAEQIRALGYLFGLHDNYNLIYPSSPSFSDEVVLHNSDGSWHMAGDWAGGKSYTIHPRESVNFARRNLKQISALVPLDVYFVDQTTATPLNSTTFAAAPGPLSPAEDQEWRIKLLHTIKEAGSPYPLLVGSETGQDWAVPVADYFEGMEALPEFAAGTPVPLFDLVYHDAILTYRHQTDFDWPDQPDRLLSDLRSGRAPIFVFWGRVAEAYGPYGLGTYEYVKLAYEVAARLNRETSFAPMVDHSFLTPDRRVERSVFQTPDGRPIEVVINRGPADDDQAFLLHVGDFTWEGSILPQYGFLVRAPDFVAFMGTKFAGQELGQLTGFIATSHDGKPPFGGSTRMGLWVACGNGQAVKELAFRSGAAVEEAVPTMMGNVNLP